MSRVFIVSRLNLFSFVFIRFAVKSVIPFCFSRFFVSDKTCRIVFFNGPCVLIRDATSRWEESSPCESQCFWLAKKSGTEVLHQCGKHVLAIQLMYSAETKLLVLTWKKVRGSKNAEQAQVKLVAASTSPSHVTEVLS